MGRDPNPLSMQCVSDEEQGEIKLNFNGIAKVLILTFTESSKSVSLWTSFYLTFFYPTFNLKTCSRVNNTD